MLCGFGLDLTNRKNPRVSVNSKNSDHKKIQLSNNNFILAFRIEDEYGRHIENESLIYFKLIFFIIKFLTENGI